MEVIDIPSSPEPLPVYESRITRSQSRQPLSQKRKALPSPTRQATGEIIEISDSDSESAPKLVPLKKKRPENHAQDIYAQYSEPNFSHVPVIVAPPVNLLQVAAPSAGSSQNARVDAVPLFYPDDEDLEGVRELAVPNQGLERPPTPVLLGVLPPAPPPQPPQTLEPPAPAADPTDACVARVLEIVPDVQPAHVLGLVEQFIHLPNNTGQNFLELVLHSLFENPDYPKVDRKGKRKRTEDTAEGSARGQPVPKIDYGAKDREYKGGLYYFELALDQLMIDFPYIPKPYLRMRLLENRFYAPTHLFLAEEEKGDPLPYVRKSVPSKVSGKGKSKPDAEFEAERQWLLQQQGAYITTDEARLEPANDDDDYEECEDGIECGCCFASYPFDKMVQCPEAHLFCQSCMSSYASNLLGEHNPSIVCMDQSGCKLLFPQSELERFLSPKLLELYHRVKQRKEIEAAGLENLEECPFCDYKCVIENEMEKLFRCENVDCGAVSCRECKKPDHLPKSCKEVESDKHLDVQHVVEEAMTRALMRNCPKCQKAFIKEHGCNKMTCPNCQTVSCYICRKVIQGYEHFNDRNPHSRRVDKTKCSLWDPVEQHHEKEVQEAAKKAMEELKRDHPDVDPSNIKVDVPVSGPAKAGPHLNQHQPLRAIPAAWGLPAVPDVYRAYGADPAADMWGVQGFRQRAELEEERRRAQMRMRLEQAALREDLERVRRNMYMAMPPLPPVPQVQPVRRHIPRLLAVPPPAAAQRRRRR